MGKYYLGIYCIFFFFFSPKVFSNPPLSIQSTMIKNYSTNDFTRISEFFTGREGRGEDTIVRTDELGRAGIYLVLKLDRPICRLSEDAKLTFRYVVSDFQREKEHVFELAPVARKSPWIFVGITGSDYHGPNQSLLAWSVELHANGETVAQKSYLWEMEMDQPGEVNCQ